jgi:pimeloyl-ACP methyl ester carboxylesterase
MTIARAIGQEIILVTTSTGGTITAAASQYENALADVAGIVFVSPNFGLQNKASILGRLPYARIWAKWLAGDEISWEPSNELHRKYWTNAYPPHAIVPMMTYVAATEQIDFSEMDIPALFYFSEKDRVVVPRLTQWIADQWGDQATVVHPDADAEIDDMAHVIAGDIVSPKNTVAASQSIIDWAKGL